MKSNGIEDKIKIAANKIMENKTVNEEQKILG